MDSYLKIIASLTRTLSHKIRTPLSIISNELHSLGAKASSKDAELALSQCKKISKLLEEVSKIGSALERESFSLSDILKGFEGESFSIRGDREKIKMAFSLLSDAFGTPLLESLKAGCPEIALSYELPKGNSLESSGICSSVSELFLSHLEIDSIAPSLFDTIILSHGWEIFSQISDGRLKVRIAFNGGDNDERCSFSR